MRTPRSSLGPGGGSRGGIAGSTGGAAGPGTTGVAAVRGTGTGWNTETEESMPLLFDSDNRFMRGVYIGMDGREHEGTFGFV